jgi:type II secretory ATPase GspE/PulE/Tfp pilus assembly ATPase PilB-like protein
MVMGQRLYLPLCAACRTNRPPAPAEEEILSDARGNLTALFQTVEEIKKVYERSRTGCARCGYTGYAKRRKAVIEIAVFNDETRDMVVKGSSLLDVEKAFVNKRGFTPLSLKAYNLLADGIIDLNQFYSITNVR